MLLNNEHNSFHFVCNCYCICRMFLSSMEVLIIPFVTSVNDLQVRKHRFLEEIPLQKNISSYVLDNSMYILCCFERLIICVPIYVYVCLLIICIYIIKNFVL
ncbi:hypothetical protein IHE45_16G053300 [Dioscorea alata]|uniref:Uncharacterized protein n=1 Tax=Dioscorea alata TaxID=55571 RepID=A0ACB7UHJ5_DIOAL|nr:hypothetical protein IHE45_16G053300 [Dioscorea alata]